MAVPYINALIITELENICLALTIEYLVTFQDLSYLNFGNEVNRHRLCFM